MLVRSWSLVIMEQRALIHLWTAGFRRAYQADRPQADNRIKRLALLGHVHLGIARDDRKFWATVVGSNSAYEEETVEMESEVILSTMISARL